MDPHEIMVDVLLEFCTLGSMPGVKDQVAFSSGMLLDIAYFALTEAKSQLISDVFQTAASFSYISAPQFQASLT